MIKEDIAIQFYGGICDEKETDIEWTYALSNADQIINLIVDKLTVIGDEEMEQHRTCGLHVVSIPMLHVEAVVKAQLQHTIKEIREEK